MRYLFVFLLVSLFGGCMSEYEKNDKRVDCEDIDGLQYFLPKNYTGIKKECDN